MLVFTRLLFAFTLCLLMPFQVLAQAEVRQASSTSIESTVGATTARSTTELSAIYEIQTLQQEIQLLRGMLEEQAYEIKRLKQQRLDDYLDLDKRVSEITQQQAAASAVTTKPATITEGAVSPESVLVSGADAVIGNNSEVANTLYNEGISLLLNEQDYDGAQTKFTEYLDRFAGGQYTPNVYYWKGQILFANGEKQAAADNFERLISEYSAHAKVPDAQFKLARIYFDQGKKAEAREILDNVAASDSDAALLAKSFIAANY
ncbi:tetratricopeptide repeat protein [Eionea flava]